MTHWLVTGGAGFIGSHLVEALLARGGRVKVLDNLSSGRSENLPQDVELVHGNILDATLVGQCMEGVSGVFHLAAVVSVQECVSNLVAAHRVNLTGTLIVLEEARRRGSVPVVFASSAAVYGDQGDQVCSEELIPAPISPYGADKLACEHHARAFQVIHGLPSAALRFFNVYGPRQEPSSPYAGVVSRFAHNLLHGRAHTVYGDGQQTRDFVYVEDVVAACISAQDRLAQDPRAILCNVCTGRPTNLLQLAAELDRLTSKITPIEHQPAHVGDIRRSLGACERMHATLGIHADTTISVGLERLLNC